MMHPPTALPRSLAEHVNPPPVDPVVRGEQAAPNRRGARGGLAPIVALFRRQPRDGEPLDRRADSRPDSSRAVRD
jgi:hypothetical protein